GTVSLDGRYLTATDWKTGDLSIRNLETGQMGHLTSNKSLADGDAEYSVPSPDGKRIANGWYGQKRCDLRLINIDGSGGPIRRCGTSSSAPGRPTGSMCSACFRRITTAPMRWS